MLTHKDFFTYGMLLLNAGYVVAAVGFIDKKAYRLASLDFWIKVYMGIYLIWQFNPFFPGKFTEFDRRVVFAAGTFLFTITIVDYYLLEYISKAQDTAKSIATSVESTFTK
jgi:hypothetical protein